MQGKGYVKVLLVIFSIIAVIQGLYILPTSRVESDADDYAAKIAAQAVEGSDKYAIEKLARIEYLDSMSTEKIVKIPLLKEYTYDDLKKLQLAFGLDLKGGYSSVLQVDLKELLVTLSGNSKDPDFVSALDAADTALKNSSENYIKLFGDAWRALDTDKKLARIFKKGLVEEEVDFNTEDGAVVRILRTKADETVNRTFNLLKQRIDKMGVVQPNVSLDAARDLILVEMPGIENPERARAMLQASAKLEFWDTYRFSDPGIAAAFNRANDLLKNSVDGAVETDAIEVDTVLTPIYDEDGNETGQIDTSYVRKQNDFQANATGPLLSVLDVSGGGGGAVMGIADKNKKKAIMEMLNRPDIKALFPNGAQFKWSRKADEYGVDEVVEKFGLYLIKPRPGSTKAPLEGDKVVSASQSPDPTTGQIKVSLTMNGQGAKIWSNMTTAAAQNGNREIAIVLDDEVLTAPRVNEPISGGRSEISGNFTVAEAADLSSMLEIGKLPAKVESIQESSVGPSLGKENIRRSVMSLLVGMGLLLLFMVFYYGGAGIISIIALLLNLVFVFASLASFGTVLTLAGIAGIVLTIGMAVDANVIIYERIREELRAGKTLLASINDGFKNSYSAIIDANVTTILVAIILFYFGLGPIKGFAAVLIIGVLCSLFTAVLVGRLMIDWWTSTKGNNLTFWTPPSKGMFANLNIDWMGKRKIAYVLSGILVVASLVSIFFVRGFDLGVDFKGGYSYNIEFAEGTDISSDDLRTELQNVLGDAVVKAVDTRNTYNVVTTYLINDTEEDAQTRVIEKLFEGVNNISGGNLDLETFKSPDAPFMTHVTSSSKVGPTIADDIKKSSIYAGTFALLLIFLYIFIRFNKWQYSLGAVTALFHDSIIVLGFFSLLHGILPISMELDQAFIAALLTVIGYSINDTVVVFDRIREYAGIYTGMDKDEIINKAINSTFSRTIITSFTTLLVVGILFVFGGSSMKGFALALLIGIVVGTYSSVFIASPIVRDLADELNKKSASTKKSFSRAAR